MPRRHDREPGRVHIGKRRPRALTVDGMRSAEEALATVPLEGCELFCVTMGQFSLTEILAVLLRRIGSCDVTISVFTAHDSDLWQLAEWAEHKDIRSLRLLFDRSFVPRAGDNLSDVLSRFGPDCVRVVRNHCKFALMRNERYNLAIRTSMNLNLNSRWENFEISDDPALCDFMASVVDRAWQVGATFESPNGVVDEATRAPFV